METKNILKRKLWAILRAAIYGAVVFGGLTWLLLEVASDTLGPYLVAAPAEAISTRIGHKLGLVNPYIVNAVLGACAFAAVNAFWQFVVKQYEK